MMLRIGLFLGFAFVVGCSSTPVVEEGEDGVADEYDCMTKVVGTNTLYEWSEAFPENTVNIGCEGELVDIAESLASNDVTVSVIGDWYEELPDDLSANTMKSWVLSGLPLSVSSQWYSLGLDAKKTKQLYDYGNTMAQTKEMMNLGVSVEAIGEWVATEIPFKFWKTWINNSVGAENAARVTELHDIRSNDEIKAWLADFRFEPLTYTSIRAGSWICSTNNNVGVLESVTGNNVDLINRYTLVSKSGLPIKSMVIFDKDEFTSGDYRLVKSIFRTSSLAFEWAECPAYVGMER